MPTKILKSEIKVQEYVFGKPFPGLLYETEGVKTPTGQVGPHAIVLTDGGYVMVVPGETMRISEPGGGLNQPRCIGRVPLGYQ